MMVVVMVVVVELVISLGVNAKIIFVLMLVILRRNVGIVSCY